MTGRTVCRRRRYSSFLVMTIRAGGVCCWSCFECAFLQPERIFRQALWRLGDKLVSRLPLWLVSFMAYRTTLGLSILRLGGTKRNAHEGETRLLACPRTQTTDNINVLVVGKQYFEFRNESLAGLRSEKRLPKAGKWITRGVLRSNSNMTV